MPVVNIKKITGYAWIPPIYTANYKITVTREDATVDDLTDKVIDFKIKDMATEGIGSFEFTIPNPNEEYTGVWTGMEIFRFYCDYASGVASTLRFRGRIEKVSPQSNNLKVTGRSDAVFVLEQNVTKAYTGADAGAIIKDLFDTYGGSRYTTSGINTSTGELLTLEWINTPFWDAIEAVCTAIGYDCYVAADLSIKLIEPNGEYNLDEGIAHDHNLFSQGDFSPDVQLVKNKITITGGEVDGTRIRYTAKDATSQAKYGIRVKQITDDSILTFDAAKDLGDYELALAKDPPIEGSVTALMLATLQPAQNIFISNPAEGLTPAYYKVIGYEHRLEDGLPLTEVFINKQPRKLTHVFKDQIQRQSKQSGSSGNPDDLEYAYTELFNASTGSGSNIIISDGVLSTISGTGYWVSDVFTADANVIKIRMSVQGDDLPGVTLYYSIDGGQNYTATTRDTSVTLSVPSTTLRFKIDLDAETAKVDSLQVQYSTE